MGLLDRLAHRFGYIKASDLENIPDYLLAHAATQRYNMPDGSIYANQASLYAKLSWIHTAISTPGANVATTAINIKRRDGDKFEDEVNHPFEKLLDRPNPLQSRFEILEATYAWTKVNGNAYWWLNRTSRDQEPDEIWILPPHMVTPIPDGRMFILGYEFDTGMGQKFILDTWQIMHVRAFNPLSLFVGLSKVEPAAGSAAGDLAQQEHNLKFFDEEGGRLPGVFAFKDSVQPDEWKRIKKEFRDGATKEQFVILQAVGEKGIEWTPMEISRKEMQFLEARNFTKEEIYDLFAPGLTAMLAPNANVASGRIGKETLMEFCVYPFHQQLSLKLTNDILPAYGEEYVAEFDDVREKDRTLELKEQEAAWKVMKVDEVRERFWMLEPLGDERGDKLVDGPGETPDPFQESNPLELPSGEGTRDNSEQGGEEDEEEIPVKAMTVEVQPTKAQLVRDELNTWQRWVTKRMKAGKTPEELREFEVEHVPASLRGAIEGALEAIETADEVGSVFSNALNWQGYP